MAMLTAKPKFRVEVPELRRADRREYVEAATMLVTELLPLLRDHAELWPDFMPHVSGLLTADRERVYAELPRAIEPMDAEQRTALWKVAHELIRRHREFSRCLVGPPRRRAGAIGDSDRCLSASRPARHVAVAVR